MRPWLQINKLCMAINGKHIITSITGDIKIQSPSNKEIYRQQPKSQESPTSEISFVPFSMTTLHSQTSKRAYRRHAFPKDEHKLSAPHEPSAEEATPHRLRVFLPFVLSSVLRVGAVAAG